MLVLHLNSQLGNQMFQYALGRKLKYLGREIKYDNRYYNHHPDQYQLNIFNLKIDFASDKEIAKSRDEYRSILDRVRRKFIGKRNLVFEEINSTILNFKPKVFFIEQGYIDGYWQSEKYFKDIRDLLLADFVFPIPKDKRNIDLLTDVNNKISVSIHVRRGDYVGGFPLMSKEYYDTAINYFAEKYQNVFFVVFSNDIKWCRENIQLENGVFVDWNIGKDSFTDMYLMTQCKHNIIANSSFSWWGAWLNQYINKEVIAPNVWLYHQETPDIYCDGWITLPI